VLALQQVIAAEENYRNTSNPTKEPDVWCD
jgi:hypothetical protein